MATVVNNPSSGEGSGVATGLVLALLIGVIAVVILFVYGLPAIQQSTAPQIQVPDQIDVNISQPGETEPGTNDGQ